MMKEVKAGFLLLCFFVTVSVSAQKQLNHEKKVYTGNDGVLYWNKALPFFMHLSTSPNSEKHELKNAKPEQYVNPSYFDTEGPNFIRTKWAVNPETGLPIQPQVEIEWQVHADGIAPKSSIDFLNTKVTKVDGDMFANSKTSIELKSKDEVSGIENIYYSLNGKAYQIYKKSIPLNEDSKYTIKYYAVDNVGNVETEKSAVITLDSKSPSTTHALSGDIQNNIAGPTAKMSLEASETNSGLKKILYSIDGGAFQTYSSEIAIGSLAEGDHTVRYKSLDNVNNEEPVKELKFYLDKKAPMVIDEVVGDKYILNGKEYSSSRTKLKLTAVDNKAGVKSIFYTVDGTKFEEYKQPFFLPTQSKNLTVSFYSIDKVNNSGAGKTSSTGSHNFEVDLTGPSLSHEFIGDNFRLGKKMFISSRTQLQLKGVDDGAGVMKITYILDKEAQEKLYEESFTIAGDGLKELTIFGYDNVNNTSKKVEAFYLDNTGPEVFIRYSNNKIDVVEGKEQYPDHTKVFLSATDKDAGYQKMYYSVNDGPETEYHKAIKGLKSGEYTIKVRALDVLNNESTQEFNFLIE